MTQEPEVKPTLEERELPSPALVFEKGRSSSLYAVLQEVACHPDWSTLLEATAAAWEALKVGSLSRLYLVILTSEDEWQNEVYEFDPSRQSDRVRPGADPLMRLHVPFEKIRNTLERGTSYLWFDGGRAPRTAILPVFCGQSLCGLWVARIDEAKDETIEALGEWGVLVQPLANLVARALAEEAQKVSYLEENRYFRERERRHYLFKNLICESPAMRAVYDEVNERVELDTPVLITGEAGTGKELIARALHHLSGRKNGMLISLHCSQLDENLLDFELFGCVASELAGAVAPRQGIFELARDGTVFLDEIDLLSHLMQGKIVRTLKEKEVRRLGDAVGRSVNSRLIASTHRDLTTLLDEGRLRHDLYLALSDHILEVPPLRRRREDIMPLARTFLRKFAHRYGARCTSVDQALEDWLGAYEWPGNVRELQTVVEAAVLKCRDEEVVRLEDLRLEDKA
ncbi:MAG: sigma 54-interacting transcriptional regulator [Bradymonadaceae bacterium]